MLVSFVTQTREMRHICITGSDDDTDEGTSNRFDYLNATEGLSGWTPLHLAAIGGHVDVVYLLMEAGCDSRVQDRVGPHMQQYNQ